MLRHFLKTSFRSLLRNKSHAFVNVFGLSLGMICALIIFQKVRYELSFDQHHPHKDQIYRVLRTNHGGGADIFGSGVPYPLPKSLHSDFADLPGITIIDGGIANPVIGIAQPDGQVKRFMEEEGIAFVERDYLRMFSHQWLAGNPEAAFSGPLSVVISRSLAEKYYGTTEVVGKVFDFDGQFDLTITGVIEDVPKTTSLPFNMLINFELGEAHQRGNEHWGSVSSSVQCFVMLPEGMKAEDLEARFPAFIEKHAGEEQAKELGMVLQPLEEVHFETELSNFAPSTARENIYALVIIGIFLLITACINFINLNTVLVFRRSREIGLRKVLGSTPQQIIRYFLSETGLITALALLLALALVPVMHHYLEELIQAELSFSLFKDPVLLAFVLLMGLVVVFLSGGYPALLLSRLHPVNALKNKLDQRYSKGLNLRRGLVVIQFMISQVLIISTLVMVQQMDYFYSLPLGYDQNAIVEVSLPNQDEGTLSTLKQKLLSDPKVAGVAYSNSGATSSSQWWSNFRYWPSSDQEQVIEENTQIKYVDEDFISTFGMNMLLGDSLIATDTVNRFIINEAMVRLLGFEDPTEVLGDKLWANGFEAPISGVIQDFHTVSLHDKIAPVVMMVEPNYYTAAIKLRNVDPEVLAHVEESWQAAFPDKVYEYHFLDETIAEFYENEQRAASLFQVFAGIAILIGCMGLFGLISFMAAQRKREIGIRKVLGATVSHILSIFSKEFALLVVIGFVIAGPIAWWAMDSWLQEFAYRIHIGFGIFFLAMLASLLIVMLTVGYQSYRAATANPMKVLRDE